MGFKPNDSADLERVDKYKSCASEGSFAGQYDGKAAIVLEFVPAHSLAGLKSPRVLNSVD